MKSETIQSSLVGMYRRFLGVDNETNIKIYRLPQAGSDRKYFRLISDKGSAIGTYVEDKAEGKCFVELARLFLGAGCNVPNILAVENGGSLYLQEDLGSDSLFAVLSDDFSEVLIKETLTELVKLQKTPQTLWNKCVVNRPFSVRQVKWDLNYFKYEYLKQRDLIFDEDELENDFELLSQCLCNLDSQFEGFMMRDCQSRNVMINDHRPFFIDFQGGRLGPAIYDAVSFLWQARLALPDALKDEMLRFYVKTYVGDDAAKQAEMLRPLDDFVLFRTLQVLGAYGYRGLIQHRAHFLESIPGALRNLESLVRKGVLDRFPELKRISILLASDKSFKPLARDGRLRVEVFSFSFKKGYPSDFSGNGGGFMFDCRAMHNPGRYAEYKSLTGRDREVKEFLERIGEVKSFLNNAWGLTDAAVERYIQRGFSNLQIGFGCTGGQHRSVYCAEATARHLQSLFPEVDILLSHREQQECD